MMKDGDKVTMTLSQLKKLVKESQRKEIDDSIMNALREINKYSKDAVSFGFSINKYLDEINPEYIRLFNICIKHINDAAVKLKDFQY